MKNTFKIIILALTFLITFNFIGCSGGEAQAIELMGAGDRIHDSYTFANVGVKIKKESENIYTIYGSVEKFENQQAKEEFSIDSDIDHVVAIKLTAIDCDVEKENVIVRVNGLRAYDAEHLNGSDYTFIILEAVPNCSVTINVKWCEETEKNYVINFADNLILK